MRVTVFGLGYVGCVSGACIAEMGHDVCGVDVNPLKVEMVSRGRPPIVETGLADMLERLSRTGRLTATTDWKRATREADVALVCVGTPSRPNGSLSLDGLRRVAEQIGTGLRERTDYSVVAVRSTVLPGTVEEEVVPIVERFSGKVAGRDFGVCMVPEFLREGTSIDDFFNPPSCVIGELDCRSGDPLADLFKEIPAPLFRTRLRTAEMLKYADNAFHALKVTFANEIGNICKEVGCDSHEVMDIFCKDRKLNLSPYYLKPGFAFGGSCLPKDVRAIVYKARQVDVEVPVLGAILDSNRRQVEKVVTVLSNYRGRSLGFLGLSFKHGTDDLRESPMVALVEAMLGRGFNVRIYDEHVQLARLVGANKEYVEKEIPHISSLMCDTARALIGASDVVVVGNQSPEFRDALDAHLEDRHVLVDLVRIARRPAFKGDYYGLCW